MAGRFLDSARAAYRALPEGPRGLASSMMRAMVEPALAARLPTAVAALRTPAEAALLMGLFQSPIGQGTAARLLAAELAHAGVTVARQDLTAAAGAPIEGAAPTSEGLAAGAAILAMNPETLTHTLARGHAGLIRHRRVIGYWVWELEQAPRSWARLQRVVHEVWAPTAFAAAAIARVINRPVLVAPHPVALAPPAIDADQRSHWRARLGVGEDDFLALQSFSLASALARKNPLGAIAAFKDAFPAPSRARLVLRMSQADRQARAAALVRAAARDAGSRVMVIEAGGLEELHGLYAACDVYLSLHRSEGFGLNLAEAMMCARAVIATAWSGNLDFMDETAAALIPARLEPVKDPQGIYRQRGARWAAPEHEAAVAALRRLAEDPAARASLAARGQAMAQARLIGGGAARALRMQP